MHRKWLVGMMVAVLMTSALGYVYGGCAQAECDKKTRIQYWFNGPGACYIMDVTIALNMYSSTGMSGTPGNTDTVGYTMYSTCIHTCHYSPNPTPNGYHEGDIFDTETGTDTSEEDRDCVTGFQS